MRRGRCTVAAIESTRSSSDRGTAGQSLSAITCPPDSPSTAPRRARSGGTSSSTATARGCGRSMPMFAATAGRRLNWSRASSCRRATSAPSGTTPCYDWWEEHADGVHPSTLAAITAGLRAAVALGVRAEIAAAAIGDDRCHRRARAQGWHRRRSPRQDARSRAGRRRQPRRLRRAVRVRRARERGRRGDLSGRLSTSSHPTASTAIAPTRTSAVGGGFCSPVSSVGTRR